MFSFVVVLPRFLTRERRLDINYTTGDPQRLPAGHAAQLPSGSVIHGARLDRMPCNSLPPLRSPTNQQIRGRHDEH